MSTSRHEYASLASLARDKARGAMHQGNPESARRWIDAATAADNALGSAFEAAAEAQAVALAHCPDGAWARLLTNLRQTLADWER